MLNKFISTMTAAFLLAASLSVFSAESANAVSIADNSTVSLVSMDASMRSCGSSGSDTAISSTTRVRSFTTGDNFDFSAVTTASFVWDSTRQSEYNTILNRGGTTRTTFSPTIGTTYTFYRLKEGSTSAKYFCHAGQVDLLINGTDAITGWVVSNYTFFTAGESSGSTTSAIQQAAAAAAASWQASIAKGKAVLATQFSSNKSATAQQLLDAGYGVRNSAVAEKVSAAILKLPVADREKSEKINEIINLENFIDRVAVLGTRTSVTSNDLVSRGLLPADSVYKYSVVQGLANYPDGSLNSMEKIAAAIKAEIVKAGARKAKTEAIKAKIAARRG